MVVTDTKNEKLLTPADLRKWLSLGRSKTYELLRTGQIPSLKIGRLIRVRHQDAEKWIEEQKHQPQNRRS